LNQNYFPVPQKSFFNSIGQQRTFVKFCRSSPAQMQAYACQQSAPLCVARYFPRVSGLPKAPKADGRDAAQVSLGRPWRASFFPARRT